MRWSLGSLALVACVASVIVCEVARRRALARGLLDVPNERSLHSTPTPRVGGVGIVISASCVFAALALGGSVHADAGVVVAAAMALACVGLVDDVRGLGIAPRLVVQLAAAGAVVAFALRAPDAAATLVAIGIALALVASVNFTNFMDGMDGLAGVQCGLAALTLTSLHAAAGDADLAAWTAAVGGATLGFLAHNAPPARVFLGDVGSTFLGLALMGSVAVAYLRDAESPWLASSLTMAPFLLDGSTTLARRALRGERFWLPHREHLYQRAVRAGRTHREVLLVYLVWIAGACASALALASSGLAGAVAGWALALVGLASVWSWVRREERAQPA